MSVILKNRFRHKHPLPGEIIQHFGTLVLVRFWDGKEVLFKKKKLKLWKERRIVGQH